MKPTLKPSSVAPTIAPTPSILLPSIQPPSIQPPPEQPTSLPSNAFPIVPQIPTIIFPSPSELPSYGPTVDTSTQIPSLQSISTTPLLNVRQLISGMHINQTHVSNFSDIISYILSEATKIKYSSFQYVESFEISPSFTPSRYLSNMNEIIEIVYNVATYPDSVLQEDIKSKIRLSVTDGNLTLSLNRNGYPMAQATANPVMKMQLILYETPPEKVTKKQNLFLIDGVYFIVVIVVAFIILLAVFLVVYYKFRAVGSPERTIIDNKRFQTSNIPVIQFTDDDKSKNVVNQHSKSYDSINVEYTESKANSVENDNKIRNNRRTQISDYNPSTSPNITKYKTLYDVPVGRSSMYEIVNNNGNSNHQPVVVEKQPSQTRTLNKVDKKIKVVIPSEKFTTFKRISRDETFLEAAKQFINNEKMEKVQERSSRKGELPLHFLRQWYDVQDSKQNDEHLEKNRYTSRFNSDVASDYISSPSDSNVEKDDFQSDCSQMDAKISIPELTSIQQYEKEKWVFNKPRKPNSAPQNMFINPRAPDEQSQKLKSSYFSYITNKFKPPSVDSDESKKNESDQGSSDKSPPQSRWYDSWLEAFNTSNNSNNSNSNNSNSNSSANNSGSKS